MEAASGGYEAVGRILLERGADVNAAPAPNNKETALLIAAEKGHTKFVSLLVEYGAHVEAKNKKGCTALWLAAHQGHFDIVNLLVSNGRADPDSADQKRATCLMAAFKRGHVKICKYLVKHVRQFPADAELSKYIGQLLQPTAGGIASVNAAATGNQPSNRSTANTATTNNDNSNSGGVVDRELIKRCEQCMAVILAAKDKQAQEAARNASLLLKELDAEKSREDAKKAAAQRKREKRKQKKQRKQQQQKQGEEKDDDDDDDDDEVEEPTPASKTKTSQSPKEQDPKEESNDDDDEDKSSKSEVEPVEIKKVEENLKNSRGKAANNETSRPLVHQSKQKQTESRGHLASKAQIVQSTLPAKPAPVVSTKKQQASSTTIPSNNSTPKTPVSNQHKANNNSLRPTPSSSNQRSKSQTGLTGQAQSVSTNKANTKSVTGSASKPSTTASKKSLADLDDFADPVPKSKSNSGKLGELDDFEPLNQLDQQVQQGGTTSRITVPTEKYARVLGRNHSNVRCIKELTGCQIELNDKDRVIFIRATNSDACKYASELVQALIANPDFDLNNLLPSTNNTNSNTASSSSNTKPTSSQTSSSNNVTTNSYNPLFGSVSLLKQQNQPPPAATIITTSSKPKNFAEAVAASNKKQQPTVSLTKPSQGSNQTVNNGQQRRHSVSPNSSKTTRQVDKEKRNGAIRSPNTTNISSNSNNSRMNGSTGNIWSESTNKQASLTDQNLLSVSTNSRLSPYITPTQVKSPHLPPSITPTSVKTVSPPISTVLQQQQAVGGAIPPPLMSLVTTAPNIVSTNTSSSPSIVKQATPIQSSVSPSLNEDIIGKPLTSGSNSKPVNAAKPIGYERHEKQINNQLNSNGTTCNVMSSLGLNVTPMVNTSSSNGPANPTVSSITPTGLSNCATIGLTGPLMNLNLNDSNFSCNLRNNFAF